MTREEAIKHLEDMKKGLFLWDMTELIDLCISALSVPESTDLISREAVIDLLNQFGYYDKEMERDLSAIPSAIPEREKGEWFAITQPWVDTQIFRCTCCGRHIEVPQYEVSTLTIRYPFCHCGADMREGVKNDIS